MQTHRVSILFAFLATGVFFSGLCHAGDEKLKAQFARLEQRRAETIEELQRGPVTGLFLQAYYESVAKFLPAAKRNASDVHIENLNRLLSFLPTDVEGHGFLGVARIRIGAYEIAYDASADLAHSKEVILRHYVTDFLQDRNASELARLYQLILEIPTEQAGNLQTFFNDKLKAHLPRSFYHYFPDLSDFAAAEGLRRVAYAPSSGWARTPSTRASESNIRLIFPAYRSLTLNQVLKIAIPMVFLNENREALVSNYGHQLLVEWIKYYADLLTPQQMKDILARARMASGVQNNFLDVSPQAESASQTDVPLSQLLGAYIWIRQEAISISDLNELGDYRSTVFVPYMRRFLSEYPREEVLEAANQVHFSTLEEGAELEDFKASLRQFRRQGPKIKAVRRRSPGDTSIPKFLPPLAMADEDYKRLEALYPFRKAVLVDSNEPANDLTIPNLVNGPIVEADIDAFISNYLEWRGSKLKDMAHLGENARLKAYLNQARQLPSYRSFNVATVRLDNEYQIRTQLPLLSLDEYRAVVESCSAQLRTGAREQAAN